MASSVKVVVRNVRNIYPKLFEADDFMGKKRYSIGLLIPKESEQAKQIKAAIMEAAKAQWGDKAADKIKSFQGSKQSWCLREYDENTYQVNAKRAAERGVPAVVDQHKNDLTRDSGLPYGGCWVNASIVLSAYNKNGAQGITCFLNGVQLVKDFDDLGETGESTAGDAGDCW